MNAYDFCCLDLGQGGDMEKAKRACQAAFWQAYGKMPDDPGAADLTGDITGIARKCAINMSQDVCSFVAGGGEIYELSSFDAFGTTKPTSSDSPQNFLFKEILVLEPGVYDAMTGEFEVTLEDLDKFAAAFNPADPPPIQVDHSMSANDSHGYIRALKVENGKLWALGEFIGAYACERVLDKRWRKVSGGFYVNPHRVREVSVVTNPAFLVAGIKRKDETQMSGEKTTVTAPVPAIETAAKPPETVSLAEYQAVLKQNEELRASQVSVRLARDEADFVSLCRDGFAAPADKEVEMKILAELSEATKLAYCELRRKVGKAWEAGRETKSATAELAPPAPKKVEASESDLALAAMMQAVKSEITGKGKE